MNTHMWAYCPWAQILYDNAYNGMPELNDKRLIQYKISNFIIGKQNSMMKNAHLQQLITDPKWNTSQDFALWF